MTHRGRIKFFNRISQYGFIERENGEPDLFFGKGALPYAVELRPGDRVMFEPDIDRQGRPCVRKMAPA